MKRSKNLTVRPVTRTLASTSRVTLNPNPTFSQLAPDRLQLHGADGVGEEHGRRAAYLPLPTFYFLLLYFLLPTPYFLLPAAYLLLTSYCLPPAQASRGSSPLLGCRSCATSTLYAQPNARSLL